MSAKMATLKELDSAYGIEDLYDMIEIMVIDAENRERMNKWIARNNRREARF